MQSLDDFNKSRLDTHRRLMEAMSKPQFNGIACPKCGAELIDSNPNAVLCSIPPQKNVKCLKCEYQGFRYA